MYTYQRCIQLLSPVYSLHCLQTMEPLQFLTHDTMTAECGWEFSSVVERLPRTCETLGSNPSADWQESRAYYNSHSTAQVFLPNCISCSFTAGKKTQKSAETYHSCLLVSHSPSQGQIRSVALAQEQYIKKSQRLRSRRCHRYLMFLSTASSWPQGKCSRCCP